MSADTLLVYSALFGWSFAAATLLPLGSEPALFAAVLSGRSFWTTTTVATIGNVLGASTTYWLAKRSVAALERRGAATIVESRPGQVLRRYGAPALLLSWVPIAGDALVAAAGAVRVPWVSALVWLTLGKAARYVVVAWTAESFRG
jgi:membrane protein YqaA with SNARE-associated domain